MDRPLRLATFAVPLSGNKGSASMFVGLRDAFAGAGIPAQFAVFSYYPKRDAGVAARFENVSVHPGHPKDILVLLALILLRPLLLPLAPARWKRALEALRESDAVLLVGGTTFEDSMVYKVPWNVLAALPAYWLRRPVVFLSQTIGPLENALNRAAARWTFDRAAAVHGRGRRSDEWVRRIGVKNSTYQPDLSFSMRTPTFDEVAAGNDVVARLQARMAESGRTCVGVAPNSIVYTKAGKIGKDYVGFMAGVMRTLSEQGHLPVLIPHSYRDDISQIHNNDRSLCLAIIARLGPGVDHFYVDADLGSAELRALIGRLHLLVASRFHSMISSLAMGVPPITYGWGDHKYLEVLEEFRVPELYASFRELDIRDFPDRLRQTHERREELSRRIRDAYQEVSRQSREVPQTILKAIRP